MRVSLFLVVTFAALQTGTAEAPCSGDGESECTWQATDNVLLQMGSLTAKEGEASKETAEGESTEEAAADATAKEEDTATGVPHHIVTSGGVQMKYGEIWKYNGVCRKMVQGAPDSNYVVCSGGGTHCWQSFASVGWKSQVVPCIVGKWIKIAQGMSSVFTKSFSEGLTTTTGSSVSATRTRSTEKSLASTVGFEIGGDWLGGSVSASETQTTTMKRTNSLSATYSASHSKSTTQSHEFSCDSHASGNGQKWWMYQWVLEEGDIQTRTTDTMCTYCHLCQGPLHPQCPPNFCKDAECQSCFGQWQA